MEVILPQQVHDAQKFLDCAEKLDYDEFEAKMFVFCYASCDVDVFELMGNDRLTQLIYGWEVCQLQARTSYQEESLRHVVNVLAHHSLQLWFSQEWRTCSEGLKHMLLYCLTKAVPAFYQMENLCKINWPYVLKLQTSPWCIPYLQDLFRNLQVNKQLSIEHAVPAATDADITFLIEDGLELILLRLMQLFNAGNFEALKQLSLRMLAAWLKFRASEPLESVVEDTKCITVIGHLYLLTVFVNDENRGYVIDNLMYNIRFYALTMHEASVCEDINLTPARLIAQVCVRLQLSKSGFFDQIGLKKFKLNLVTSFAVMLDAYTSYVLGNQLLELMSLNEHDFLENLPQFKELMYRYVVEREGSERFLLEELNKLDQQRNSHHQPQVVSYNLNFQQQICKGNRASNIGNYKNCDDDEKPVLETDEEQDRQIDPVFQNVPNNEEVLTFVYKLLAERHFTGWKFAKIALLLKIIGQQLNAIEIWRYHPGLTTEFMLNLEQKMSKNYADLAKVFSDHAFMEAEFWLTAFYLNPINVNYNEVKRCSRIKKKRQEDDSWQRATAEHGVKYELLSSTIDVDEIVTVTNHSAPVADYDPIYKALQALRLPRSIIKDLLTVAFQPRNKRYSWALDWYTLHERCSALLKSKDLKNKFVALNMAEANDRLEFLKIDYAKYKDRPQLDYGTIEEGYENAVHLGAPEVEPEAETVAASVAEDVKVNPQKRRRPAKRKFWDEVFSEDEEEEVSSSGSEAVYTGTGRRTRVRAAAMVANAMLSDMDRSVRCGRRSSSPYAIEAKQESESEPEPEAPPPTEPQRPPTPKEVTIKEENQTIDDLMEARTKFSNETSGFKAFADIWSFEKEELQNVQSKGNTLMECSSVLSKFKNLRALKQNAAARPPPSDQLQPLALVQPKLEEPSRQEISLPDPIESDFDTQSANSDTSTMATHDFNGEDDDVFDDLPGPSGDHSSQGIPTVDFTQEAQGRQEELNVGEKLTEATAVQETKNFPNEEDSVQLTEELTENLIEEVTQDEPEELVMQPIVNLFSKQEESTPENPVDQPVQEPLEAPSMVGLSGKFLNIDEDTDTAEETLFHEANSQKPQVKRLKILKPSSNDSCGESPEAERARLIHECLTRRAEVRLTRLTPLDIEKLRGFRVRIKRTNLVNFCRDQMQRKRIKYATGRYSEDSSASTQSSEPYQSGRKRFKQFVHITSDSPAGSASPKPVFKHVTSDSSTDLEEVPPPVVAVRKRGRPPGPRCKAKKIVRPLAVVPADVIELSSDSLSSNSPVPVVSIQRIHFTQVMEMDPLYEEEIVPF
ncbi:uncharacterized protein Dana_GF10168 [Drosophila ananassae]|uniref:Uncharacterized protein n=1 Tax=Drosophila ananassae TaxID=7217 RepID=B3M6B8_DROAN|nr:uncharacterized protein LOC6493042 [Drosophila ananassae]EDV39738.1 uncharacterized protein Dana_GF10168 [Drosophila ananassae]